MRKIILFGIAVFSAAASLACPLCERNQPKILRGIVHGGGPESKWDYWIVCSMLAVVVLTLFYSVKWLIRPGEKNEGHIKRTILKPAFL